MYLHHPYQQLMYLRVDEPPELSGFQRQASAQCQIVALGFIMDVVCPSMVQQTRPMHFVNKGYAQQWQEPGELLKIVLATDIWHQYIQKNNLNA